MELADWDTSANAEKLPPASSNLPNVEHSEITVNEPVFVHCSMCKREILIIIIISAFAGNSLPLLQCQAAMRFSSPAVSTPSIVMRQPSGSFSHGLGVGCVLDSVVNTDNGRHMVSRKMAILANLQLTLHHIRSCH